VAAYAHVSLSRPTCVVCTARITDDEREHSVWVEGKSYGERHAYHVACWPGLPLAARIHARPAAHSEHLASRQRDYGDGHPRRQGIASGAPGAQIGLIMFAALLGCERLQRGLEALFKREGSEAGGQFLLSRTCSSGSAKTSAGTNLS